jgi:hypothetical protein
VDAVLGIAVEPVEDHRLATVERFQRAALVLAILEHMLLMRRQMAAESLRHARAIVLVAAQGKQQGIFRAHGRTPSEVMLRRLAQRSAVEPAAPVVR